MTARGSSILTQRQADMAASMRGDGASWDTIGRTLGVSRDTVRRIIEPGFADVRRALGAIQRAKNKSEIRPPRIELNRVVVPADVMIERDRRMNAPVSLSVILFGDPRPGQSALDRKCNLAQTAAA